MAGEAPEEEDEIGKDIVRMAEEVVGLTGLTEVENEWANVQTRSQDAKLVHLTKCDAEREVRRDERRNAG